MKNAAISKAQQVSSVYVRHVCIYICNSISLHLATEYAPVGLKCLCFHHWSKGFPFMILLLKQNERQSRNQEGLEHRQLWQMLILGTPTG